MLATMVRRESLKLEKLAVAWKEDGDVGHND